MAKAREAESTVSRFVAAVASGSEPAMKSTLGVAMQSSKQLAKVIERVGGQRPVSVTLKWMKKVPVSADLVYANKRVMTCLLTHGQDGRLIIYDIQF